MWNRNHHAAPCVLACVLVHVDRAVAMTAQTNAEAVVETVPVVAK